MPRDDSFSRGIRPFQSRNNSFSASLRARLERGVDTDPVSPSRPSTGCTDEPMKRESQGDRFAREKSVSPSRREALRRKFKLSTDSNNVAQEWRRILRRFNEAQDGNLLLHEFITAVRAGDVPSNRGIVYWSDRELEELWLAVKDEAARPGASVDVEELVHFLCSNSEDRLPQSSSARSEDKSAYGAGAGYLLEDSLVDEISPKRQSYMPEDITQSILSTASAAIQQRARTRGIDPTPPTSSRRAGTSVDPGGGTTISASLKRRNASLSPLRTESVSSRALERMDSGSGPTRFARTESIGSTRGFGRTESASSIRSVKNNKSSMAPSSPGLYACYFFLCANGCVCVCVNIY